MVVAQSSRVEDMASFGQGKEDLVEVQIENAALVAAVRKADDAEVDSLVAEGMVNGIDRTVLAADLDCSSS